MNRKFTVAEYIANFISEKDVPAVFQLSGGMIAFIADAIFRLGKTKLINLRHEQAAGFAAESASRVHRSPAVALATSGPGASNLITAISSAYFDSTPVIFITGQVHQNELRKNALQRQSGFQELDIVSMVSGITKYAVQISNPSQVIVELDKAWRIAAGDRPGPVLLDIPINIQQEYLKEIFPSVRPHLNSADTSLEKAEVELAVLKLLEGKSPLILVGGGVRIANQVEEFRKFADKLGIPVVYSLMGADAPDRSADLSIGLIGSYGNRWANKALSSSDCVLVLGSRLDPRQTGNSIPDFLNGKYLIRVDLDDFEINGRISADFNIKSDLREFLRIANETIENYELSNDQIRYVNSILDMKAMGSHYSEQDLGLKLNPNSCLEQLAKHLTDARGFIIDVGQHQMWSFQSITPTPSQRIFTSGGLGAMGFAIPAGIGAAITTEGKWVVITGDGCAQLSIAELQTIRHYNLDILIVVVNNNQHGMVSQFQDENMSSRHVGTREGYSAPDFCEVAKAFGIRAYKANNSKRFNKFLTRGSFRKRGPFLLELDISSEAKALPKFSRIGKQVT
jgi:acetolactate synthase-1/2/3 large subunit